MTALVFVLGDVAVPLLGGIEISQEYSRFGGFSHMRLMNGAAHPQHQWAKIATVVSANGWLPDGLQALDFSTPLVMKCIRPQGVLSASNVITLPAARRTDAGHTPYGYGFVGERAVQTPVSMGGNDATLTAVAGATRYQALYYPQITVISRGPVQDFNRARAEWSWSLEAEEA